MAEPTPPLTADRPGEPLVYRPLSGLAILGLACGVIYGILVVVSVALAFFRHEPFLLPSWLLLLAAAGFGLSVLALRQIRNSEGTRAGTGLARLGLWVSLLAGLGYGTYSAFTGLAIRQQANRFLTEKEQGKAASSGFFPHLQAGDIEAAYLLTLAPRLRTNRADAIAQGLTATDEKNPKGQLTIFAEADFVQLLQDPKARVEPQGVRTWAYEGKGYKVERIYRIVTPEGSFEMPVTVQSADSDDPREGRRWRVLWSPGEPLQRLPHLTTDLGDKMRRMRGRAIGFVQTFLQNVGQQRIMETYFATRAPSERASLRKWAGTTPALLWVDAYARAGAAAGSLSGGPVNLVAAAYGVAATQNQVSRTYLPGLHQLLQGTGPVTAKGLRTGSAELADKLRGVLPSAFLLNGFAKAPNIPDQEAKAFSPWKETDGKIEVSVAVELMLPNPLPAAETPEILVLGRAIVAADKNLDTSRPESQDAWRLVRFEFHHAYPVRPGAFPGR